MNHLIPAPMIWYVHVPKLLINMYIKVLKNNMKRNLTYSDRVPNFDRVLQVFTETHFSYSKGLKNESGKAIR